MVHKKAILSFFFIIGAATCLLIIQTGLAVANDQPFLDLDEVERVLKTLLVEQKKRIQATAPFVYEIDPFQGSKRFVEKYDQWDLGLWVIHRNPKSDRLFKAELYPLTKPGLKGEIHIPKVEVFFENSQEGYTIIDWKVMRIRESSY